ncbi:MAG: cell envelope integrity protein TolA [Gammaproteobacteria bacterium]|nr:cell envelope integrity protein TolA [Gammaproteobacteria bacterium]
MNVVNATSSYVLPFFLAVFLHLVVGFGVNIQWSSSSTKLFQQDRPIYLNATLVNENPYAAKKRREANERQQKRLARQKREQQIRRLRDKETAAEAEKERLARLRDQLEQQKLREVMQKMQAESPPVVKQNQKDLETERQLMEQGLVEAIRGEQEFRIAVTDDERALAYVGQIQRQIIQNWSRPPSARNGMQALLKVYLVPTGEVVEVVVIESSSNEAFDRSAILAVRKSERFVVPEEPREFEKNFREFSVLFKPEDLRL